MLLLIDTSGELATVILASDGIQLAYAQNATARDHSAWLHPSIAQLLAGVNRRLQDIQAIAVTAGPGSYTGLRVGLSAAKGFCYALKIPLITCNNLLLMAASMIKQMTQSDQLLCPMIDARRQEVFTALYTSSLEQILPPCAMILDKTSFEYELRIHSIFFAGNGAEKFQNMCISDSAAFLPQINVNETFIRLATASFYNSEWSDITYSEPEYGKEFHTHDIK